MPLDPEHYCIQANRIEKMDKKLNDIHDQFQVDGAIGEMSGQLTRLITLAENGSKKGGNGGIPNKLVFWIIAGFVAIIAALVGANLPIG